MDGGLGFVVVTFICVESQAGFVESCAVFVESDLDFVESRSKRVESQSVFVESHQNFVESSPNRVEFFIERLGRTTKRVSTKQEKAVSLLFPAIFLCLMRSADTYLDESADMSS